MPNTVHVTKQGNELEVGNLLFFPGERKSIAIEAITEQPESGDDADGVLYIVTAKDGAIRWSLRAAHTVHVEVVEDAEPPAEIPATMSPEDET